jgi:hypothetical protein
VILLVSEFNERILFNYFPKILDNQVFRDNFKNQGCFNVSHYKLETVSKGLIKLVNLPGKRRLNVNQIVELSQQDTTLKFNDDNTLIDNVKSKF